MNWRSNTAAATILLSVLLLGVGPACAAEDVASYVASAKQYLQKNDFRGAEIQLRNALKRSPKDGDARLMLAKLYLLVGAPNTAEAELIVAAQVGVPETRIAPLHAEALYDEGRVGDLLKTVPRGKRPAPIESAVRTYRGLAELILGDLVRSEAEFADAIKLDGRAAGPRVGLARLYLIKQQLPTAEATIDAALKAAPHNSDALDVKGLLLLVKGDIAGGIAKLDAALAANPNNLHAMLDRADAYIASNQLDRAYADIQRVQKAAPDSGTANYLSAVVNARRGKLQDADAALEKLRPVMDQMPDAYFLAAVVKYNLEQLEQAEAFARRYVAQRPDNPKAYELLGSIALRRGDATQAVEMLQQAVKLAPNDANAVGLLAEAQMAQGDTAGAMALLDRTVRTSQGDARLRVQRAIGRMAEGDEGQSLTELMDLYRGGKGNPLAGPPLVLAALHAGKIDVASTTAEKLVETDPANVFNQQLLGVVRMEQRNYPAAENIFRGVLAKSPNLMAARTNLARIYLATNRADDAKKLFTDRLTSDPSDLSSAQALAEIYVGNNDFNNAIAVLQTAQNAMTDNPAPSLAIMALYAQQKKWPEATRLANSIAAQFANTEQLSDALGTLYIQSGDLKSGVATYKRATDAYPNSAHLWERYAAALVTAKDYAGALDALAKATALDPGNGSYKSELVSFTYQAKGADAALATAKSFGQDNPDNPAGALLMANVLDKAGKRGAALALLQKAQSAHPTIVVLLRLCALYQEAGTAMLAADLAADWIKAHPDDFVVRLLLAELYGEIGNYDLAQANFERLLVQRPNDSVILNNLAWLYSRKNDPRALKLAQKAHDLAPNAPSIADTLGWIMTNQNDAANGLKYLQAAVASDPNDPAIQFHYAVGLSKLNRVGEARIVLQKLLHSNAQFSDKAAAEALLKRLQTGGK